MLKRISKCIVLSLAVTGCTSDKAEKPADTSQPQAQPHKTKPPAAERRQNTPAPAVITPATSETTAASTPAPTPEVTPAPAATAMPSPTPASTPATPSVRTYADTPTPIATSAGASNLAGRRVTPAGAAPQLVYFESKEPQLSADEPLVFYGFNLASVRISAKGESGQPVQLRSSNKSNEEVTVPAAEWHKLAEGTYTFTATNNRGESASIHVTISK